MKSMSPRPSRRLGAGAVEDGARVHLRADGEGDARGEVGLDQARDHVHRGPLRGDDEVDAGGARQLGQAADLALDLEGRGHHQVGQLVDDHDPVGHALGDLWVLVVGVDVAHGQRGEALVARLHLVRSRRRSVPTTFSTSTTIEENARCGIIAKPDSSTRLGSIITKRTSSGLACMRRQAMIELMQTLLPAAGRAGDQQVRHLRQVGDHGLTRHALAQRQRQLRLDGDALEGRRLDHDCAGSRPTPTCSAPRCRRRPCPAPAPRCGGRRGQRQRQVVGQARDLVDAHAGARDLFRPHLRPAVLVPARACPRGRVLGHLPVLDLPARLDVELRDRRALRLPGRRARRRRSCASVSTIRAARAPLSGLAASSGPAATASMSKGGRAQLKDEAGRGAGWRSSSSSRQPIGSSTWRAGPGGGVSSIGGSASKCSIGSRSGGSQEGGMC